MACGAKDASWHFEKMKAGLYMVLKYILLGRLFIFLLFFLDSTDIEPYFHSFYDKYGLEVPSIFFKVAKKFGHILGGLLLFIKHHKQTGLDRMIVFICLITGIILEFFIKEPTAGYVLVGLFVTLTIWICYYFW